MKVILDFDDTLYDSWRIKKDVQKQFGLSWKVDPNDIFFQKAERLLDDPKKYLFEDAEYFLRELTNLHCDIILLSYARESVAYSQKKIASLDLSFFQDVFVIEEPKGKFLQEKGFQDDQSTCFINDKMAENISISELFPNWKYIVKRAPGLEYPKEYKNFIFCNTLSEILHYL